jgi:hypothetical protein
MPNPHWSGISTLPVAYPIFIHYLCSIKRRIFLLANRKIDGAIEKSSRYGGCSSSAVFLVFGFL